MHKSMNSQHRGVDLLRCQACGLVFQPLVHSSFDEELYAYYDARLEWSREQLFDSLTSKRNEELLSQLGSVLGGRSRKVLDVGCGIGQFVESASKASWDACGIDLSNGAVAIGKRLGINVRKQDLFSNELREASFDLVTLFEVIEHVPAPLDFLKRASQLVKPSGLLYLTTPNFDCADRRILSEAWGPIHPEHLTYFTPATLRDLVERSTTMRVLRLETRNISAQAIRTLLSRAFKMKSRSSAVSTSASSGEPGHPQTIESSLRQVLERSAVTRFSKRLANSMLNAAHLGNTMVMTLQAPR
jgi:2-polyprenyl-3-methyl-5-hydroxy-6-metoxy-1,4-benzoquinol methylase